MYTHIHAHTTHTLHPHATHSIAYMCTLAHTFPHTFACRDPHCVAVHSFTAEGEGELSISPGDTIELVERVGEQWLKGKLRGDEGIFPVEFVEVKVDLPPPPSPSPQGSQPAEPKSSPQRQTPGGTVVSTTQVTNRLCSAISISS